MLHAYFCSPDKAIKKHRLEVLKSMEIELRGFQNPFKKQLQSDTAPEKAFEPQFFRKFVIFRWFLGSKTEPKSKKKCWKCDAQKQCFLKSIFIGIFFVLASENGMKFHCFLDLYRKSWFCENHCFSVGSCYFSGFEPPKIDQISMSKRFRKRHRKKRL